MPADRRYRFADVVLGSSMLLPELRPAATAPLWTFALDASRSGGAHRGPWLQRWRVRGRNTLSIARVNGDGDYLLKFARCARFIVSPSRRSIACAPADGVSRGSIRHLLLNQVMPLVLADGERLVLHASAVSRNGRALAFVGGAGYGKSTLAALAEQRGADVITDDCLVLEERDGRVLAVPTYPGIRLWPDAARAVYGQVRGTRLAQWSPKRRVGRVRASESRRSVERIYVLEPPKRRSSAQVTITRLEGRSAFVPLLAAAFQLDVTDANRSHDVLAMLARVIRAVPIYRLSCPRDLRQLASVADALAL